MDDDRAQSPKAKSPDLRHSNINFWQAKEKSPAFEEQQQLMMQTLTSLGILEGQQLAEEEDLAINKPGWAFLVDRKEHKKQRKTHEKMLILSSWHANPILLKYREYEFRCIYTHSKRLPLHLSTHTPSLKKAVIVIKHKTGHHYRRRIMTYSSFTCARPTHIDFDSSTDVTVSLLVLCQYQ
jgi:hypothetical protein